MGLWRDCTTTEIAALSWDHVEMMNENNNKNKNKENEKREGNMEGNGMENPFVRKSVITRSPPAAVSTRTVTDSDEPRSGNVKRLGEKISKLVEFLKTRSNVHKDIVTMSREIQAVYMQMSDELDRGSVNKDKQILMSRETQTEEVARPNRVQLETPKRKRDPNTLSPKGNRSKKKKDTTPNKTVRNTERIVPSGTRVPDGANSMATEPDWVKVRPRAKNRKRPARPDALIIRTCGDVSYADILRQVKSDPKLNDLGHNVRNIRKTEKGELLLELNKPAHQNIGEFRLTVEEVLGTVAEVRALSHEVVIEIRDIDEVTTREDIYEALTNRSDDFKSLQPSAIKSLRRAYGGTQTATIGLSAILASRLVEAAKIRIGWVVCRIREKLSLRRCYKCLDYGHIAAKCKGTDHSDKCLKCGESGHKIVTCSKEPSCMLCRSAESNANSDHVAGCTVCPYYRKALQLIRSRR